MTTVLHFILGSRMFRTNTADSDTDTMQVVFNPEGVFDPEARKTVHTETLFWEGAIVELAVFMSRIRSMDLKVHEALSKNSYDALTYTHPQLDLEALQSYAQSLDLSDMLIRETERRFRKSWNKDANPQGKNYNSQVGYDSKFAAHLYRVQEQTIFYLQTGFLFTASLGIREEYLNIKHGELTEKDVFMITSQRQDKIRSAPRKVRKNPVAFPLHVYFDMFGGLHGRTL